MLIALLKKQIMALRRMFSMKIVDTDAFMDMPHSAQLLYFHLSMRGDDDGFVSNPKKIMRMVGAQDDDYKILIAKRFVLPFESGVCVIKHWRIHNILRGDRYTETTYQIEKSGLEMNEYGAYTEKKGGVALVATKWQPNGNQMEPQYSIVKDSIVKTKRTFAIPTLEEVTTYCTERANKVNPERFISHYESNGWMVGKNKMKDWKAAVRTWEHNNFEGGGSSGKVHSVVLSDGTVAIKKFGEYVDGNNSNVKLNLNYFTSEDMELLKTLG